MTTRRERAKASKIVAQKPDEVSIRGDSKSRKEKLSSYLIDISKYVMTGVVISSLFRDLNESKMQIYLLGLFIAFTSLGVGIVLTDKRKE